MARKNSMKLRISKYQSKLSRANAQEQRLQNRRAAKEEVNKDKMETSTVSTPLDEDGKPQLKRKTLRRLENERARLARKGIKLVKMDDMEDETGAPKRNNKRMRQSEE